MTRAVGPRTAAALVAAVVLGGVVAVGFPQGWAQEPRRPRPDLDQGREIFRRDCVYCHGRLGEGTTRGPRIDDRGTAAVHYMISTGRMPIGDPEQPTRRREAAYTSEEIASLVDYVDGFVTGPQVPEIEISEQRVSRGARVFRVNCAACHQLVGTGGVLVGRRQAPSLHPPTPTQVGDAVRAGPGEMPRFGPGEIPPDDLDALASYIQLEIQEPTDAGGLALGHFGPFSEGFAAWLLGIGGLLIASFWIGRRT